LIGSDKNLYKHYVFYEFFFMLKSITVGDFFMQIRLDCIN
jgi:hypothetical protein